MRAWIRDLYMRLSAHALSGKMPNFADCGDPDVIARFGKDHAWRLQDLRRRYDPGALFAGMRHPDGKRIVEP